MAVPSVAGDDEKGRKAPVNSAHVVTQEAGSQYLIIDLYAGHKTSSM